MKRRLDIGTAGGLVFGIASILGSFVLEGGEVGALILIPAMVIVFGGTVATAFIGSSTKDMKKVMTLVQLALFPPQFAMRETIDRIVGWSHIARKEGLLTLDKELPQIDNTFMKKILRYAIDGTSPEMLRSISETELKYVAERHARGASLFHKMGGYSPTMGIIGTVMGLIATLASAGEDPNKLIHHIASAFIATLWGVFMANLVWLPIADKLRHIHHEEEVHMDLIIEGILAIQAGEVPTVIKAKLNSMLPAGMQEY